MQVVKAILSRGSITIEKFFLDEVEMEAYAAMNDYDIEEWEWTY